MRNPVAWEEHMTLLHPIMMADSPVIDEHDCTEVPTKAYEWDLLLSEDL